MTLVPRAPFLMCLAAIAACCAGLARAAPSGASAPGVPVEVKVLVVNMFQGEAAPWIEALHADRQIAVPGLPDDYPSVRCNADAVCQMTTGMGHANAAASLMAVLFSRQFDFRRTWILIAGIAGIDPQRGTIGTVTWARYAVDVGLAHEIDGRELPAGWNEGFFGVLTGSPDAMPDTGYRTEVFRLDEALLQRALALSKDVALGDSAELRAYRQHYPQPPANAAPGVTVCDTASGDTWWTGERIGEHVRHWVRLMTRGEGVYCTTQQEDNATLESIRRAQRAGLADFARVAILRSGSDFDRPYPGQDVLVGLRTQLALKDAFRIAAGNLVRAGMPLVEDISRHWSRWRDGVPAGPAP